MSDDELDELTNDFNKIVSTPENNELSRKK